jgi:hypothetical protein
MLCPAILLFRRREKIAVPAPDVLSLVSFCFCFSRSSTFSFIIRSWGEPRGREIIHASRGQIHFVGHLPAVYVSHFCGSNRHSSQDKRSDAQELAAGSALHFWSAYRC